MLVPILKMLAWNERELPDRLVQKSGIVGASAAWS